MLSHILEMRCIMQCKLSDTWPGFEYGEIEVVNRGWAIASNPQRSSKGTAETVASSDSFLWSIQNPDI